MSSGAIRLGARGARAGASRFRRFMGAGDETAEAGARAVRGADDAAKSGARKAAEYWGPRAGGAAALGGAGALAYRQQDVWQDQAQADQSQAIADMSPDVAKPYVNNNNDDESDGPGFLEKLRDMIPGVESIQETVIFIAVAAIVIHVVMNQSDEMPNSPVVVSGRGGSN